MDENTIICRCSDVTLKEIRDLMTRRGVTIADLAEEIGVSEDRIDSTLNGYTFLSDKNAREFA